jgi:thiosulfate/3-mercaptopyruvate sulfurtransferase
LGPLIGAAELSSLLGRVRVFDVRWSLLDPLGGRARYLAGHVPGAVFVDLERDLASTSGPGRHPLPSPEAFASTLGAWGLSPGDEAVVYDDAGGTVAARLWWMLLSIGHERVRLLDGGWPAWVAAGGPAQTDEPGVTPTLYPSPKGWRGALGRDQIAGRALVDARAPERYRGETEPIDPKAGHIPGAVNVPASMNLTSEGRFRSRHDLTALYHDLPDDVVVSCGSGVTACHTALAMTLAGRPLPDLYVGSFSDWCSHDLPIGTGTEP